MQIVYGGTQTRHNIENRKIFAPSAIRHPKTGVLGEEMTKSDIETVIKAFGDAAVRVKSANFDGVQIHSAHHYLLSQFISPIFNLRNDEYGGCIENRSRIIIEVYEEVRRRVGSEYPVIIKLDCTDSMPNGITLDDVLYVCMHLNNKGIDGIEISGCKFEKKDYEESYYGATRCNMKSIA